jgi:hypothetical protein
MAYMAHMAYAVAADNMYTVVTQLLNREGLGGHVIVAHYIT